MNDQTAKRIAAALERMADADERRNELLVADAEARRLAWQEEQDTQARRWAELAPAPEASGG